MRNRVLVSVCSISIAFALLTPVTAADLRLRFP